MKKDILILLLICTLIKSRSIFHLIYTAKLELSFSVTARKGGFIDYAVAPAVSFPSQNFPFRKNRELTSILHFNKLGCTYHKSFSTKTGTSIVEITKQTRMYVCAFNFGSTLTRFFPCFKKQKIMVHRQCRTYVNKMSGLETLSPLYQTKSRTNKCTYFDNLTKRCTKKCTYLNDKLVGYNQMVIKLSDWETLSSLINYLERTKKVTYVEQIDFKVTPKNKPNVLLIILRKRKVV